MHLGGARVAQHPHDLAGGRPADDRIVHHDDPLALDEAAHRVQFHLDAEVADGLLGLDERAPDVVVAHQAEGERDARLPGEAEGGVHSGVRHGNDDVGRHRVLPRQLRPEGLARRRDALAEDDRVGRAK